MFEIWESVRAEVVAVEADLSKNVAGNASAGIRVRRSLRNIKKLCVTLNKLSVASDKAKKLERAEAEMDGE